MYIPFRLIDDKTSREIPAKYVQLFLNSDDPYAYRKMSAKGPTFVGKILTAPDTSTWEKPDYTRDNLQYFTRNTVIGPRWTQQYCVFATPASRQR